MARKLNAEKGSPFYEHIIVPAENDFSPSAAEARKAGDWAVSLATVVEGTVRMISANPKKDACLMAGEGRYVGHERSVLPAGDPRRTPLRELYRECNDEVIYTALENFFQAVNKVLWSGAGPDSFIRKTVGIQALFDVARALLPAAIETRDLRVQSFAEKLKPASEVNFADRSFHASGASRTMIRKTLEYAMKSQTLSRDDPDYEEYRRILG